MLIGAMVAVAWSVCPAIYGDVRQIRLEYAEGTTAISAEAHDRIADFVSPMVGDEMAELQVSAYFPYGEHDADGPNGLTVAQNRVDAIRQAAIDLGVAPGLVETSIAAIRPEDQGPDRVWAVDLNVRVATDCHPLADKIRRANPYD